MEYLDAVKSKIYAFTLITTIINGIIALGALMLDVCGAFMVWACYDLADGASQNLNGIDSESVTAGYEALFNLGGQFVGIFAMAVAIIMVVVMTAVFVIFLIVTIHGITVCGKSAEYLARNRVKYVKAVKRDSVLKLVINGAVAIILLVVALQGGNLDLMMRVFVLPFLVVVGFSIANLCLVKNR